MLYNESKVCARVKEWREKCGHSQEQVARCIGTTRQTLSEFEQGNPDKLRLGQLLTLCRPNVELDGETIPMMDCELGYLLGEEGYENRTRTKTDICKATGLSEVAVSSLQESWEFLNDKTPCEEMGFNDEKALTTAKQIISKYETHYVMLRKVIELLLTSKNSERITETLDTAIMSKRVHEKLTNLATKYPFADMVKMHEQLSQDNEIISGMQKVMTFSNMFLMPSDEAATYLINEASLAFRKMLEEMLSTEKECLYGEK